MMTTTGNRKWLAACLIAVMLCMACGGASAETAKDGMDGWSDAYHAFVTNQTFLDVYPDEFFPDTSIPIDFALHDVEGDGVPELMIGNGADFEAGHCRLFFSYRPGGLVFIGTGGTRLGTAFMYGDTPGFPGLFYQNGNMGYYPFYYYSVKDGELCEEIVFVDEETMQPDGTETEREIRETADDALYAAAHGPMEILPCFTMREIADKGWAWFLDQYPALRGGGNQ